MKNQTDSYVGLDSLPWGTGEEAEVLTGVLLMPSSVKEERICPFPIHPVKEINDRMLYLMDLLFFISLF